MILSSEKQKERFNRSALFLIPLNQPVCMCVACGDEPDRAVFFSNTKLRLLPFTGKSSLSIYIYNVETSFPTSQSL